jgi:plasmid stabilization system protein ParE
VTYRVIIQPTAETSAREVYLWLFEQSPASAERWYRGLREAIESLAEHPQRCPLAPENEYFEEEIGQLLHGRRRGVYRALFTIRRRHGVYPVYSPRRPPTNPARRSHR